MNKWNLIKAKRHVLLDNLNELKFKINSKKLVKTHIVTNKIVRTLYSKYIALKAQRVREHKAALASVIIFMKWVVHTKKFGGSCVERERRVCRKALIAGTSVSQITTKEKAQNVFIQFMRKSADQYQR